MSIGTTLSQAPLLARGNGADNSGAIVGIQVAGSENGSGILGYSQLPNGSGVKGEADVSTNDGGFPAGVWAISGATNGTALYAEALNNSGPPSGFTQLITARAAMRATFKGVAISPETWALAQPRPQLRWTWWDRTLFRSCGWPPLPTRLMAPSLQWTPPPRLAARTT